MVVCEKIVFEAWINKENIWPENNIAQLYFILGRSDLFEFLQLI